MANDDEKPIVSVEASEAAVVFDLDEETKAKMIDCIQKRGKLTVKILDLDDDDVKDIVGAASKMVIVD